MERRGGDYREGLRRALAETGLDPAAIERELAKLPPEPDHEPLALDLEEWTAASLLLALDTQWKTAGMTGVIQGLDYQAIEPTARLLGVEVTPAVFLCLRTLEAEALRVFAEKRRK
ncbi:MAG: DUF1799 domain-containing protein [Sandaracinobacter sp.]